MPRLSISLLILLLISAAWPALAQQSQGFTGLFEISGALRTVSPVKPSSEFIFLSLHRRKQLNSLWSTQLNIQEWMELAYEDQPNYPDELSKDSVELRFQDVYLERRDPNWIARTGIQHVSWGEVFGNSVADVINPRDLRRGVSMDQSRQRLGVPMFHFKSIGLVSIEGLVIPEANFDILPLPGSDHLVDFGERAGFAKVVIERQKNLPVGDPEYGARLSTTVGSADLAIFYFNHFDRSPSYLMTSSTIPGLLLSLKETHTRVTSQGFSVAVEIDGSVLRAEALAVTGRQLPASTQLIGGWPYNAETSELRGAIAIDLPTMGSLNLSLQLAGNRLSEDAYYFLQNRENGHVSARAKWTVGDDLSAETIATFATKDKGTRLQAELVHDWTTSSDLRVGIENYAGPEESEFGAIRRASRVSLTWRTRFAE